MKSMKEKAIELAKEKEELQHQLDREYSYDREKSKEEREQALSDDLNEIKQIYTNRSDETCSDGWGSVIEKDEVQDEK